MPRTEPLECGQTLKILRLVPDSMFVSFLCPFFAYTLCIFSLFLSFILPLGLQGPTCALLAHYGALAALIIPGGFFHRSLIIYLGLRPRTCVMLLHVPFFAIICIDMTYVLAKLGCLAPVLTPTFPFVRLGGKGSISAIVTAGSAVCVPQTG